MPRWSLILIALLLAAPPTTRAAAGWPGVPYTEVRAYAWPAAVEKGAVVGIRNGLVPGSVNPRGVPLNDAQVRRLLAALDSWPRAYPPFSCHIPRNAFVFRQDGKIVAVLEICFDCMNQRSETAAEANRRFPRLNLPALAGLCEELGVPVGTFPSATAFQKKFRQLRGEKVTVGL